MADSHQEKDLDEQERAEFLAAMQQKFEQSEADRGEMIKGTIVSLGEEFAFVDLGGKSEGILSLAELIEEGGEKPKVGDPVEACVISSGPEGTVLSKKLAKGIRSREFLAQAARTKIPVEGRVESRNKGGFDVEVAGIRAFCPIGQIELRFCEDPDVHVGKKYTFLITKFEDSGRRPDMVLSRRVLLEAEARKKAEELRKTLKVGDIVPGTVRNIKGFGVFVDLGGLDGFLPVSELAYHRVNDPKDVVSEGEEIHVQVLQMEQGSDKITLSLKRLEADPWEEAAGGFAPGSRVVGKVVRIEAFGAFVELIPGVDGLIHVSNFNAPDRVSHPKDVVQIGQELNVEILSVDSVQKRIGLARVPADGEFGSIPTTGAVIEGKVESVAPFGVFVTLGPGRKGLVPNAEMGTAKGTDHRKQFAPGTPMKVMVMEVIENGKRIRLSRQAAAAAEERAEFEGYVQQDGVETSKGFGTIGDLLGQKTKK
jgi:small subunit ribosomal protein S1